MIEKYLFIGFILSVVSTLGLKYFLKEKVNAVEMFLFFVLTILCWSGMILMGLVLPIIYFYTSVFEKFSDDNSTDSWE